MPQPDTRPSLIARLQGERSELAWVEFVSAYEPFLRCLVRRHGTRAQDVSDVVQHVFLAIERSLGGWQDDGQTASFRRWLHAVARNVVIKFVSKERRQPGACGGTDFWQMLQQTPDPTSEVGIHEYEHELVLWAAEQVRDEFRESSWKAFWATQIEGRSVAETATELNVTAGAIYMSRSRILAKIRSKIAEVSGE